MEDPPSPMTLPDDILLEILSRLPAKSLLRFRCISKSCRALISDSTSKKLLPPAMVGLFKKCWGFAIRFASLPRWRTYIDLASIDTTLSFLSSVHRQYLCVHDCCNGLLLLSSIDCLFVCNPATRRWICIPKPRRGPMVLALAFDPRDSPHYRVVSFSLLRRPLGLEVFSSETGEWTNIKRIGRLYRAISPHARTVFLKGIIYIMDAYFDRTYALDLKGGLCGWIQWPDHLPHCRALRGQCCLGVCRGRLHYAFIVDDEICVLVLQHSWSDAYVQKYSKNIKKITSNLSDTGEGFPRHFLSLVTFHPDLDLIFLHLRGMIFSYHLISDELEEVCYVGEDANFFAYSPCYADALDL